MQTSGIPTKNPTPWADSAVDPTYKHTVPVPSQVGITAGAASWVTGFPPTNFDPAVAGGVPPFGNDFNGVLNALSLWQRWQQAGGAIPYDATFQTAIGGYPLGAIVASAVTARRFWVSTSENNVTDPDAGGAGWQVFGVGNSGVTAGSYNRPQLTIGSDGRVTAAANAPGATRTLLTSGTAATYTVPANCTRLRILAVGAGGGTGTTLGGVGGTTTFNSVTAIGGSPGGLASGANPGLGGLGGTGGTGGSTQIIRRAGQRGGRGAGGAGAGSPVGGIVFAGGQGGNSLLGFGASSDEAGIANTGAGAGGVTNVNATAGSGASTGGGGGGEGFELWIFGPAASYVYTIGAGGIAGTNGFAGGSGYIIVEEYYD